MKTDAMKCHLTNLVTWPLALLLLLLTGCLEKHLVWSPDGQRAAVIAKGEGEEGNGLYLCDADGKLTARLVPAVYRVAWLGDSQQLVVARSRKTSNWAEVARILGAGKAAEVAAKAEAAWEKTAANRPEQWSLDQGGGGLLGNRNSTQRGLALGGDGYDGATMVYLWAHHADGLRALYGTKTDEIRAKDAFAGHELLMARIVDDKIQLGTTLYQGLAEIQDIRIAPGDRAVAFTEEATPGSDKESRLMLARINGTGAVLVAERTSLFADWTADGRSLVYVQALGGGAKKDDLRLASLVRREVVDDHGQINVAEKAEDMAGLMYSNTTRVRCLRDGRILFNTTDFQLPVAKGDADAERERLFALDPARQATLVRMIPRDNQEHMPKVLAFFEVSPDEKQVLVGGYEGEVSVLTLSTGEVQQVQESGEYNLMAAPVWRQDGEITYARRNPTADGKKPERKAEIVLRQGDKEKVLSQGWSDDMLEQVFPGSDKK
ncbi:MAG TPA: hypothetical protein VMC06_14105 [Opitutaceae bacterium]|nr:hypothetical protein [Opitutaceae bacterium]